MKNLLYAILLLASTALFAGTPPQVINKTCPVHQWFEAIVPGQTPVCTQPSYSDIAGTPSVAWGAITGTIGNQSDLSAALAGKQDLLPSGTSSQYLRGDKTVQTLNTSVVPENGNLYYTAARFNAAFGAKTTADLTEGSNLYFTQARARGALSASAPLSYNSSTGAFTTSMATGKLLGRSSASAGVAEEISVGSGLSLSAGTLTATGGTVTEVTAASPLISSGGTTPEISIPAAGGSANGYLSSTDWNTFNSKQSHLTLGNLTEATSSVLNITGGTGAVIGLGTSIQVNQAGASQPGFLSAANWSTFNNKQPAGNYLTALTGDVSASGPGSAAATISGLARSKLAAGTPYLILANDASGVISENAAITASRAVASDANGQLAASATTATQLGYLASATAATADATHTGLLAGSDFASFAAKQSALSFSAPLLNTAGTISCVAATGSLAGCLSAADWTTFNGKQNALTIGNISSATTGLSVSGGTGAIIGSGVSLSIQNATTSQPGLLTAADWNTFNSKQAALTLGNLTSGTTGVSISGGTGAVVGSGASVSVQTASTSQPGLLSAADWATFNGKQAALAFSAPLVNTASTISCTAATGSVAGCLSAADWTTFNAKQSALSFSTGLTNTTGTITVNTSQNIATLSNLTGNGFVKTSGGTGALSIDTSTYLTGNQTVTLSGDVSGSGATAITTAIGANKVTDSMLATTAAHTYIGNNTGSTATPSAITSTQLTADLNAFTSLLQGLVPASGGGTANFLRADGSFAAPTIIKPVPTVQKFISGSGTYNLDYAFVITSGSATVGATYTNNAVTFTVYATVASATQVVMSGSGAPAASGTLTKASGTGDSTLTFSQVFTPSYIRVVVVGSGGAGAGSADNTNNGGTGGNGTASTFGSSLLSGSAGVGGTSISGTGVGGTGGAASLGTGPLGLAIPGGSGTGATGSGGVSGQRPHGGAGGSSCLGGGGGGGAGGSSAGYAGATNSGAGGGGAGAPNGGWGGSGGGAGGCVQAVITAPSATYAYAVGGASTAGSAGTSGQLGGTGAAGVIIVEEHYQ